jgi:hypothetical protein
MSDTIDDNELPEGLRLRSDLLSILNDLAAKHGEDRRRILRPHDDVGMGPDDGEIISMRRRLDEALAALTRWEIASQLGLYNLNSTGTAKYLARVANDFSTLIQSDAFLCYLDVYLYFGVRFLAGRIAPPAWWQHQGDPVRPAQDGPSVNKRPLPLPVPPVVENGKDNQQAFERFLALAPDLSADAHVALDFLDGFHPDQKEKSLFDAAEFELWLRGLRPDAPSTRVERFEKIRNGLVEWSHQRAEFYLSLEPATTLSRWNVADPTDRRRPKGNGWVITNAVSARIALADFYSLAHLLRAEVSANSQVSYPTTSWMHILYFQTALRRQAISAGPLLDDEDHKVVSPRKALEQGTLLHKQDMASRSILDDEEVLRSVFDFACDLVLNAIEISDERERRFFASDEFPAPRKDVKQWREVFDEELRELKEQKDRRDEYPTSVEGTPPSTPATPQAEGSPPEIPPVPKSPDDRAGWSERLWTRRDTRRRIGLAFSGGGIRSATFNLGVLEGLQELDLLRKMDYLSTVSGGGFIGSWLLGNVYRSRYWLDRLTNWDDSIAHLRAYSNYLAPLTGIFSADTWTLGISWIRNAFLVQVSGLAWIFVILSVALLTMKTFLAVALHFPHAGPFNGMGGLAAWLNSHHPGLLSYLSIATGLAALAVTCFLATSLRQGRADTGLKAPTTFKVLCSTVAPAWIGSFLLASMLWSSDRDPVPVNSAALATFYDYSKVLARLIHQLPWIFVLNFLALLVVGWIALAPVPPAAPISVPPNPETPVPPNPPTPNEFGRRAVAAFFMSAACTAVLYLELCGVSYLFLKLQRHNADFGPATAFVFGPSLVVLSFTVSVVMWIGLSGRIATDPQREWWTRFGAWLTMFGVASLALEALAVFGPWLVAIVFGPHTTLGTSHPSLFKTIKWTSVASWLGTIIGGLLAGNSSKTGDRRSRQSVPLDLLAKIGGFLFIIAFFITAATTLSLFLSVWGTAAWSTHYWSMLDQIGWWLLTIVLVVVTFCGFIFSRYFDINIFGLSRFYQYRLVRCYLGATRWNPGVRQPHPFTGFDRKDDLCLGHLKGKYKGPYPILNCTLNLAGSSDVALNTRHSASFSLTPKYCGTDRPKVGYVPTGTPGIAANSFAGGVTLGQATAISGAAASPNMGYNTSPLVAFLLTMFNVRLGWWFPNPGGSRWNNGALHSSLYYLTRELLGLADERRDFLNVTDGGHFENLAIYELIRRRCAVIIVSDAECDQLLQFGGLGNVLRICGTDFGAQIEIDVKSIRTQKDGHSLAHSAVGKIKYDNGSIGYLIYLKASITGDEDPSILQYRATHPTFPHETTANQFFTEDQFESYRKLGLHVVRHSFRGTQVGQQPFEVSEQMYDTLAAAGCSSATFLKHTQTLERIWAEFRATPVLAIFLDELMLGPVPPQPGLILTSAELAMGLELIQLMEEAFLDLQLDDFWEHPDNRGWAILFMRWARSPRFQSAWKNTHRTYGIRFEYFCAFRLGLEHDKPIVRV